MALRAATAEKNFRRDIRGAIVLFVAFLLLRGLEHLVAGRMSVGAVKVIHAGWMLTFAFGVIRTCVSLLLLLMRWRAYPVPKILRDVVDFSLYSLVAIPILHSQISFDFSGLLATSAVASVVLGLALQETLGNLFAGLSIQLERPFQVNDFVGIKEERGRVVQIGLRATRIETQRREVITVPNNMVSKEAVKNFSRGTQPVGTDLYIGASYDAPPNRVKRVVLETLAEIPLIVPDPPAKCRTWSYDDSSIRYQIRYFVASYGQSNTVKDEIYSRLWYRLRREHIGLPYPQRTLHISTEMAPEFPTDMRTELLRTVDLFQTLNTQERERLADDLLPRRFGAGERIIEEGAPGQTFYIVAAGEVSVKTGKAQVEVVRLKRGQYFGEMSLLTGEPRSATIVAVDDAVLFEVDRPTFAKLFAEQPGLARQLSALLAQRRTELRAVAEANGPGLSYQEAGRILTRLKAIFGLKQD